MSKDESEQIDSVDLDGFEKLLEHRLRLTICVLLSRYERLSFSRIKALTGETDGNLGANLRRLEDAGFLVSDKKFQQRKPVTWYLLAPAGRSSLRAHLDALARLISGVGEES